MGESRSHLWVTHLAVIELDYIMKVPSYHFIVTSSLSLNVKYLFW